MRVLFIGGTKRGYLALQALADAGAHIVGVISLRQDDHETERYEEPMRALAERLQAPLCETRRMNERDYAALIRDEWRPDVAFVVGCRILLPAEVYTAPPGGTFAVHDSCLPECRGFAPLNWSVLTGADHTGVTLFQVTEETDAGDILAQERIPIGPDETAPEVYERVCAATADLLRTTYPQLAAGTLPRRAQDASAATYTCRRTPADGLIDWHADTTRIYNQVRALTRPYPGAFSYCDGRKLTIWQATPVQPPPRYVGRIPGRVVGIDKPGGTVDVLTGDGVLRLGEIQFEGDNAVPAATAIRSVRATLGVGVDDLLRRIAKLEERVARLAHERTPRRTNGAAQPSGAAGGQA